MKRVLKICGITLISIIVIVVCYLAYVLIQYHRIDDNTELEITNNQTLALDLTKEYKITTYNIGFGAYNQEYSFFMDEGKMKDGTATVGKYAKAVSKEVVETNTEGVINTVKVLDADFMFFQEVDVLSTRAHKVNQLEAINNSFSSYSSIFACNYDSAYLLYPFNDPIGMSKSGIVTLSKYEVKSSLRRQFPLSGVMMSDLFDLDRCFSITRIKVTEEKDLVLINLHMSAFDEGGKVRAEQMTLLNKVMKEEINNYVIIGGDFNHALNDTVFASNQERPEWVADFPFDSLTSGYTVASATNCPTCRGTDIAYEKGVTYSVVIDGFIINSNIEVVNVQNIDNDFVYSDHNPCQMTFKLK